MILSLRDINSGLIVIIIQGLTVIHDMKSDRPHSSSLENEIYSLRNTYINE